MPADDAINDQELQLKKRARRRLVGAIALVLLMVIFLPWVLEDRTTSAPKEKIDVSIPSLDQSSLDNSPTVAKTSVQPVPAPLLNEKSTEATTPVVQIPADPIVVDNAHVKTETAQQEEPQSKLTISESSMPTKNEVILEDDVLNNKIIEEKRLEAEKAAAKKEKRSAGLQYYVQIGVFSDVDNVKKIQNKLKDLGYQSNTEKVDTAKGEKIRLRTTLFNDRNEAAIALQNIKDAGFSGMVVSQK